MAETSTKKDAKRDAALEAASDVFACYGFRRTAMNDIAEAAGISRPALYLLFENKEDLFRQLITHRQRTALDRAEDGLNKPGTIAERIVSAILAYERSFYEEVSQSPHGEELMDMSQSLAADDMKRGHDRLVKRFSEEIRAAEKEGDADLSQLGNGVSAFVELMLWSVYGQKKSATSKKEFRQRIRSVAEIFMKTILPG